VVTVVGNAHITFDGVSVTFAGKPALIDVDLVVPRHRIFGIIGPARSGKTTLLKCINRTIDFVPGAKVTGRLIVDGEDVLRIRDVRALRRRVGMVFPLPVGLPLSVYDNVAYAPRMGGVHRRGELDAIVEDALRQAALWDEVKDRLDLLGTRLSGGQQQRLTIARALSHRPDILCLNRFSIAVDPLTTMKIEDVLLDLKARMTIVVVSGQVQQARRLADRVAFMNAGRVVETGDTDTIFSEHPQSQLTFEYVRGHFG
jgi:phosphate transport system ATP-binding protein